MRAGGRRGNRAMRYDKIVIPADGEPVVANRNVADVKQELEELVPGATLVGTAGFADAVVRHMDD